MYAMDAQAGDALGTFHAVVTRDGEALSRDGSPYFDVNQVHESNPRPGDGVLYEVQFADGLWMLARDADLTPNSPA